MLDTSAENMWTELQMAESQMQSETFALEEMISRFHTNYYDKNAKQAGSEPENPAFEWIATMQAQIVAGDPQVRTRAMKTDQDGNTKLRALGIKHSLNRLSRDGAHRRRWRKQFVDWCFSCSSLVVYRTPTPWADRGPLDGPVYRPDFRRVDRKMLRRDPRAVDWDETRWRGHGIITSKASLLERAKASKDEHWDMAALESIVPESMLTDYIPRNTGGLKGRDDFLMWQIWVPEEQMDDDLTPEDGFHGTDYWFAQSAKRAAGTEAGPMILLRKDAHYGPRAGPYIMSGLMYVPNRPMPLSIMVAIENISRSLRLTSQVIDKAMQDYKRFLIEGSGEKNLGNKLKHVQHGGIIKARGFTSAMAKEYEVGGLNAVMDAMYRFKIEQMDRRSGLTDAMKGQVQTGATATAETIAQGGATARLAGMRDEFHAHVRDTYCALGEYIDMDDRFYQTMPPEVSKEAGRPLYAVQGGREKGQSFEDYEIAIDTFSMTHRGEAELQAAAEAEMGLMQVLSPLIPQTPWVDWKHELSDYGEVMGNPDLGERINFTLAEQVAGMYLQQAMQQGQAYQAGSPSPSGGAVRDTAGGRAMLGGGAGRPQLLPAAMGAKPGAASTQTSGGPAKRSWAPTGRGVAGNRSGAQAGRTAKKTAKAGGQNAR